MEDTEAVVVDIIEVVIPQEQEDADLVADVVTVEEKDHQAQSISTRLLVTGVGFVAIWPVTVLRPETHSHREVELPTLPEDDLHNPCSEAHVAEVEAIDRFDSVASVSCMTTRVTNTPLMMQDNCMCHLNSDKLLSME